MLQNRLVDPFCGSDALLIVACKLFQDRVAAFATVACHLGHTKKDRADDTERDKLRRQAEELRTEWQAIAHAVATTPATHLAGLQAKAGALHALYEHVGISEGIEADLARSLVEDLVNADGG